MPRMNLRSPKVQVAEISASRTFLEIDPTADACIADWRNAFADSYIFGFRVVVVETVVSMPVVVVVTSPVSSIDKTH